MRDDLPPAFIHGGPDRNNGIVDGVVAMVTSGLKEWTHRLQEANMIRILHAMKTGERACYAGFLKTREREKFIAFSLPHLLTVSNRIIVHGEMVSERLPDDGRAVSLAGLLADPRLRIGVTRGRSYGETIDALLAGGRADIIRRAGDNSLKGLLRMLALNRLDLTIGFPWEMPYIARAAGLEDRFRTIPIFETRDETWYETHIGCPKNDWGERMIHRIDEILRRIRPTEAFFHHQSKWFPREMENELRAAFKTRILNVLE